MTQDLLVVLLGLALVGVGMLISRKGQKDGAKVLSLTDKINQNKKKAAADDADADQKVKEYQDALKAYDPNFGSDDESGPKGSA